MCNNDDIQYTCNKSALSDDPPGFAWNWNEDYSLSNVAIGSNDYLVALKDRHLSVRQNGDWIFQFNLDWKQGNLLKIAFTFNAFNNQGNSLTSEQIATENHEFMPRDLTASISSNHYLMGCLISRISCWRITTSIILVA